MCPIFAVMDKHRYNRNNFHKHTFCIYKAAAAESIAGLQPHYTSKSGSTYYFTGAGVYRLSNHWGRAAHCRWRLEGAYKNNGRMLLGYADWNDFFPDNDVEKLYFVVADFENQSVQFFHKQSDNYTQGVVLRTAAQTIKRIKQIRHLFSETAWSDYLNGDLDVLRREITGKLITTEHSFHQIRKEYL